MFSFYSQAGTIIRAFQDHPNTRLTVSFFQKGKYFVGYKVSARICELIHKGYLVRSEFDHIVENGQHFAQYEMTSKGYNLDIPKPSRLQQFIRFFNF